MNDTKLFRTIRNKCKISLVDHININYSLWYAGCQKIIKSITVPAGKSVEVEIPTFSEPLHLKEGTNKNLSLTLKADAFAQISAPIQTQLIVKQNNITEEAIPIVVSPLCAWNQLPGYAKATATFVLENDPIILQVARHAKVNDSDVIVNKNLANKIAENIYYSIKEIFKPVYLYERAFFPKHEQAIRFPAQMKYDVGGCCIDLVLVYAAALYRSGLNPVVCKLDGHALVGLWNNKLYFHNEPIIDAITLEKNIERDNLIIIESNCLYKDTFEIACAEGRTRAQNWGLLWGNDIRAARSDSIQSLPGMPTQIKISGIEARIKDQSTLTRTSKSKEIFKGLKIMVTSSGNSLDFGKSLGIERYRIRIGRDPGCNEIIINNMTVRRVQAVLFLIDSDIYLEDLASKNGTFVKGQRIVPYRPQLLQVDQEFKVGDVELRIAKA